MHLQLLFPLTLFTILGLAPFSNRMLTDSLHPENVASIRGVSPFYNIKAKEIANTSTCICDIMKL